MIPILRRYSTKVTSINDVFKSTMSRISAQAMILTSGTGAKDVSALHGMTMSSVCSLSVYPVPLLQFNLHLPSYTSQSLHENRYLAVHLLPPTPKSVYLGRIFASGVKTNQRLYNEDGELFHEMTTPFAKLTEGKDYTFHNIEDHISIPILEEGEEVLICEAVKNFLVDDHEIWIVKVLDIKSNEKYQHEKTGGLLYFNRAFHRIGNELIEEEQD